MTTRTSKYAGRSLMLIRVGGVALLIGVLGNRVGLIGLGLAFGLFGVGFLLSAVALVMALVTLVVGRRTPEVARRAGIALVLAVAVVAIPVSTILSGGNAPAIHHITTDTQDPPQFDAVIALRGDTSNSLEYTADIAGAQRRAYPDIQPLFVQKPSGRGVRSQRAGGAGAGLGGCQRRSCGRPDRGDRHHVLVRIQG